MVSGLLYFPRTLRYRMKFCTNVTQKHENVKGRREKNVANGVQGMSTGCLCSIVTVTTLTFQVIALGVISLTGSGGEQRAQESRQDTHSTRKEQGRAEPAVSTLAKDEDI